MLLLLRQELPPHRTRRGSTSALGTLAPARRAILTAHRPGHAPLLPGTQVRDVPGNLQRRSLTVRDDEV
eukprot:7811172-Alexandrium_andersonii.AAC.1